MSKLQAALAKIGTTARPALADNLHLPALTNNVGESDQDENVAGQGTILPGNAADIKKWLIVQNAVNSTAGRNRCGADANTLLKILQHNNRSTCTSVDRMHIMEVFQKPFTQVMQRLDAQYLYFDFPLAQDSEQAFWFASTLCQEMAFGYKRVVADLLEHQQRNSKFAVINRKNTKIKRWEAIRSAIKYLTLQALRYALLNRDWPAKLWQDLSTLHNISIQDRSNTIEDPAGASFYQPVTIEQQYASLCALSVLHQNQLLAEDVRSLFLKICKYAHWISLHESVQPVSQQRTIYSVGIGGPMLFNNPAQDDSTVYDLHYFSLDILLEKLHADDDLDTTYRLSDHNQRNQPRAERSAIIAVATGLPDIHTKISLTPPSEYTESQFTDLMHLLSHNDNNALMHVNALNQIDVLNQTDTTDCNTLFEVENEGTDGFGLKWTGMGSCTIQIGELLAHNYEHTGYQQLSRQSHELENSWHLSVVRWLHTDADGILRLGVESLSHHTKAVSIKRLTGSKHSAQSIVEGLLLNYQPIDSKAQMLILPRQHYKAGESVACRDDRNIYTTQLVECIEISAQYQCFAIKNVEAEIDAEALTEVDLYRLAV